MNTAFWITIWSCKQIWFHHNWLRETSVLDFGKPTADLCEEKRATQEQNFRRYRSQNSVRERIFFFFVETSVTPRAGRKAVCHALYASTWLPLFPLFIDLLLVHSQSMVDRTALEGTGTWYKRLFGLILDTKHTTHITSQKGAQPHTHSWGNTAACSKTNV